ncbi:ImmA/IrrE family metallo-endopeptidase [Bifidobacterium scardovii]|uniref:ImmA/IrrE family metallo-endopeptidase n=1 Tax=Bifidobacterium scardovii TaxID=158787 RepID=UPI00242B8F20|nr:ImmA/IrrE family metallo-endopeptidase [Bifidobacterium scardovii]MBS6948493.1 ImmA/IrrE family metallo-endopeptidase [Bifidobacterium scardovii]
MRRLPLNLHDTYGHIRMAVYAAGLDVEIRSAVRLPGNMMGCYSERTRTILIDRRLPYVAKRCVLVHELVHWQHGDDRCGLHEQRTREETARLLISPLEYAMAERLYEGNIWGIADELSVTTNIINDYQTMLHERNRVHA